MNELVALDACLIGGVVSLYFQRQAQLIESPTIDEKEEKQEEEIKTQKLEKLYNSLSYYAPYSNFMHSPDKIIDGLFLGNLEDAENLNNLQDFKITHVVTCMRMMENDLFSMEKAYKVHGITMHAFPMRDAEDFAINNFFEETSQIIHDALGQGKNVLVHCYAGVSRSTTIVIAYLLKFHKYSLEDAVALLRRQRPIIHPNFGFLSQLVDYECKLKKLNL